MDDLEYDKEKEELGKFGRLLSKVCIGLIIFMALSFALIAIVFVLTHPSFFDHIATYLLTITVITLFSTFLYGNIKNIPECDLIGGSYLFFMSMITINTIFIPSLLSEFSIGGLLFVIGINFMMLFWGVMILLILSQQQIKAQIQSNIWQYCHKRRFERLKAKFLGQSLLIKTCYYRNFKFSNEFRKNLQNFIFKKFGRGQVIFYENSKENIENKVLIEDFEIKTNGLYIATNADLEEEPPWGYIGINNINDKNRDLAIKLSKEIDKFTDDYPGLDLSKN